MKPARTRARFEAPTLHSLVRCMLRSFVIVLENVVVERLGDFPRQRGK